MSAIDDDHDLLFGLTAVELRFLTHEQLVNVPMAGSEGRAAGRSLRERLCHLKLLTFAEADAVEAVVAQRVVRHGGDVHRTVTALAPRSDTAGEGGTPTHSDRFVTQAPRAVAYSSQGQRFTVLRMHQQGGLGRLMVARDGELNREIALKEILPAFADDAENRRRFVREAEITGALEHPGIVPVYSLGEFPDGRPYYAMRLIRGVDLRMALDDFHNKPAPRGERELAFRQLLTRFVAVCMAIDYAHSRGVIHRDIKPGNIMLGDFGETLVVDWGVAKPLDEPVAPPTLDAAPIRPSSRASSTRTQAGRVVGTLVYMSPEQAAGRLDLVSQASDVYGLGATLYHLLTGTPPFTGHDEDLAHFVQQGRFQRPRAAARGVPKALEAICLKAMARKPESRYPSARALAADIERYLADEPVTAYPDPLLARAWRWAKRHRTPVMSGMAAAAVAIVGLTVGLGMIRAERDRAEANFALARQAVRDYYIQVSEETLLNQLGMQPLRDALLRQALVYYEQFVAARSDDSQLQREVAQAEFFVARITETVDSPAKALPYYERAAQRESALLTAAPRDEALMSEQASTLNGWGRALQKLGKLTEARAKFAAAADLRHRLADAEPKDAERARLLASSLMNMGMVDLALGKPAEALPLVERAQSLRLAHAEGEADVSVELERDLGMGYYNGALVELALGDGDAAKARLLEAIDAFERVALRAPPDFDNRRRLALSRRMVGDVATQSGDVEAAIPFYEQARDALSELVDRNPDVAEYRADLAGVQMNLGAQLQTLGNDELALAEMDAAATELSALADAESATPRYHRDLAVALRAAGELLAALERRDEARTRLMRSEELLEALLQEHPADGTYAEDLKLTREALAELNSL
jgi:serine/threonine protein kinase/tetratricopeptide (TPR) repeat protein